MNRREFLALSGSAAVVGTAGCVSEDDEPDVAGPGSPSDTPTDTPSATPTPTPTRRQSERPTDTATTATLPDVSTPEPGECGPSAPPSPDSYEGVPDPKAYPPKPDVIEPGPVEQFLRDYEHAYRFNAVLADLVAEDACVTSLDAPVTGSSATTASEGVVGAVESRWSFTGDTCPDATGSDTATPLPHADGMPKRVRYYVTDRFLIRDGVVVECWG